MLDIWPIGIAAREAQVSFDRFASVIRIADDQPAYNVHLIAMDVLDGLQCCVPDLLAFGSQRILRTCAQELEIIFENILNSQKHIAKSRPSHQRSQRFALVRNR